jgi:predicted pyridoxine 5'-phosphate oxidase superfamily flavin-nucleotide-binding protein
MAALREVTIGFAVGQALAVRLDEDQIKRLRKALNDGGWFELQVEDGTAQIRLEAVVYVRVEGDEHRVGFG